MPQPPRGGAAGVRYTSSSAKPQAQMSVLDVDDADSNVKAEGWFAWVFPTQTGVQMVGSGHYGWWEERPKVGYEDGNVRIEGGADEPILLVTPINAITIYVAQAQHADALPRPELKEPQE